MELSNIIRLDNFLIQEEYKLQAGVTSKTVRNRINKGFIAAIEIDGFTFIDVSQSAVEERFPPNIRRPKLKAQLPEGIIARELRNVVRFANRLTCTSNSFFRAILTGEIFGLVIGGEVFAYNKDLLRINQALKR